MSSNQRQQQLTPEKKYKCLVNLYISTFEFIKKNCKKDNKYQEIKQVSLSLHDPQKNFSSFDQIKQVSLLLVSPLDSPSNKIQEKIITTLEEIIANNYLDTKILQEMVITFLTYIKSYRNFTEDTINFKILNLCLLIYSSENLFIHSENVKYLVKNCLLIYLSNKNKEFQDSASKTLRQIIEHMIKKIKTSYNQTIAVSNALVSNKHQMHNSVYFLKQYLFYLIDTIEIKNKNKEKQVSDSNDNTNSENIDNIIDSYSLLINKNSNKENLKKSLEGLNLRQYKIVNENDNPIGKYGWCINCRNTANFFSKKINFPVCSLDHRESECELEINRLLSVMDNENKFNQNFYRKDYIIILKYLTKTSITENSDNNDPEFVHSKCRIFCLEAIREMIDKGSAYFINDTEVISIIKDDIVGSLVKNTLANDIAILKNSIALFLVIVRKFREHLKDHMAIFIKKVLIAILESENLTNEYKEVVLDAMLNLADDETFLVEIYVNYDCDVNYSTVFYDIINIMSKIIYGLYKKQKFANTLKPQEEKKLRLKCLDFLDRFIQNLSILVENNYKLANHNNSNNTASETNSSINESIASSPVKSLGNNEESIMSNSIANNITEGEEIITNTESTNKEEMNEIINQKITNKEKLRIVLNKLKKNPISASKFFVFLKKEGMIKDEEYFNTTKAKYLENSKLYNSNIYQLDEINQVDSNQDKINNMRTTFLTEENSLIYLLNTLTKDKIASLTYEDFTAFETARFIKANIKELNQEFIGDFLCNGKDFNMKVVQYFIDSFDFRNLHILDALRNLFADFYLKGETQIQDRIVQIIGQKYHKENPNTLKNPDLSYYIAFSIIMLNTDLHNENVKTKMTMNEYINSFHLLYKTEDFEDKYLADIYNCVLNKPLVIPGQKISTGVKNKKRDLIKVEKENILNNAIYQMKDIQINNNYIKDIDNNTIKILINSIWSYFLGIFSQLLADFEDEKIATMCIENILKMAGICCILNLDHFAEAYINTIVNNTNLMEGKEITRKNLQCISALINFIMLNGFHIRTCWYNLLNVISKIDFYYTLLANKEYFLREIKQHPKLKNPEKEIEIELKNFELLEKEKYDVVVENIFVKTIKFEESAIINFVENLCKISSYELSYYYYPRVFSLHKLVDVADFNIFRIQVQWVKIWKMISEHLVNVITNSQQEETIWVQALDSLRQTIWKLLKKEDLSIYNFQIDFFKPFEIIFSKTADAPNRAELVLNYIYHTVCSNSAYIHSGWIIIFNILKSGLQRKDAKMNQIILNTLQKIADDSNIFTNPDVFKGYIECLSYMYFDKNLKESAFKTILNLIGVIIKAYENNTVGVGNNNEGEKTSDKKGGCNDAKNNNCEEKYELLKLFFYGFDELFTIDIFEHLNLLFEIIAFNKEFMFCNENNAFIYIYYSFFKPHLCTLLFKYLGRNIIYTQKYKEENMLKNIILDDNESNANNIIFFMEYTISSQINRIKKRNDSNQNISYPNLIISTEISNKLIDILTELKNSYQNDTDLFNKKLKILNKFDANNLEHALDFYLEKINKLTEITDKEEKNKSINYGFFIEDSIICMLLLSIYNKKSSILFKVIIKNLLSLNKSLSDNFWKKLVELNNYILNIISTLNIIIKVEEKNNYVDDLIDFLYSFFDFNNKLFNNFIDYFIEKGIINLLELNKNLSKVFYIILQIDLNNDLDKYKIAKNQKLIDTLLSIQSIKDVIITKHNKINDLYDSNVISVFKSLSEIFSKYNLYKESEDKGIISIYLVFLDNFLPKFIKMLNKEQLETTFGSLLDLIDSNNEKIKVSSKKLLKKFLEDKLCAFTPYNYEGEPKDEDAERVNDKEDEKK